MNDPGGVLPPLAAIQAALRKTTEGLAHQLGRPGPQTPDWSDFEWRIARAVSALHGISPVLAARLQWQGPQGWRQFLDEQRHHTQVRAARLQQSLQLIGEHAQRQRVGFVALKGVALCELGIYTPAERPMSDLDLLVREDGAPAMTRALMDVGLRPTHASWKEQVFEPESAPEAGKFGEHADNPLKVDLHTRIGERLPARLVDISPLIAPATLHHGRNPYASRVALMIHLLLHAAGEMVFRTLRLIQLHDIGLLSAQFSAEEWREVLRQQSAPWGLWWALPPLSLVARYYPSVPPAVLAELHGSGSRAMHRSARALVSDVSYSNMLRSALPGIDWTRSPGERLNYAAERALISARALLSAPQRPAAAASQQVLSPQPPKTPWHRLRPVRPATLRAVQAALTAPA